MKYIKEVKKSRTSIYISGYMYYSDKILIYT